MKGSSLGSLTIQPKRSTSCPFVCSGDNGSWSSSSSHPLENWEAETELERKVKGLSVRCVHLNYRVQVDFVSKESWFLDALPDFVTGFYLPWDGNLIFITFTNATASWHAAKHFLYPEGTVKITLVMASRLKRALDQSVEQRMEAETNQSWYRLSLKYLKNVLVTSSLRVGCSCWWFTWVMEPSLQQQSSTTLSGDNCKPACCKWGEAEGGDAIRKGIRGVKCLAHRSAGGLPWIQRMRRWLCRAGLCKRQRGELASSCCELFPF